MVRGVFCLSPTLRAGIVSHGLTPVRIRHVHEQSAIVSTTTSLRQTSVVCNTWPTLSFIHESCSFVYTNLHAASAQGLHCAHTMGICWTSPQPAIESNTITSGRISHEICYYRLPFILRFWPGHGQVQARQHAGQTHMLVESS